MSRNYTLRDIKFRANNDRVVLPPLHLADSAEFGMVYDSDTDIIYKDDLYYNKLSKQDGGFGGMLYIEELPDEFVSSVLESGDGTFSLMFRLEGRVWDRRYKVFSCKATPVSSFLGEYVTKGLFLQIYPRGDGVVSVNTTGTTSGYVYDNWLTQRHNLIKY